jgi:hypothetical protein
MHKLAIIIASAATVSAGSLLSTASHAAVGRSIDAVIADINPIEKAGCYRWGETGYHWYRFCLGPRFIYPHRRVCRNGYCYYR